MTKDFKRFYVSRAMFLGATMFLASIGMASANPSTDTFGSNEPNPVVASPQQAKHSIKGVVEDALGPIAGANVVEKGTTNGTITDMDGNFSLEVSPNSILVVSYIGYKDQEIPVNNQTSFNIKLAEDSQALDEVVVVGYGTQKKVNLSGSVSTINVAELTESRPITNVSHALAGLAAGVNVQGTANQPGNDNASIKVRGQGTLNESSPLVIIDGVEAGINTVNPQDIESMTVLKDAASSAIYGDAVWKALLASVMTPFLFGLLYSLRRPTPLKRTGAAARGGVDGLGFAIVLAAVAALYLLFLGVQSAGLFGGAEYLAQKGLSYAEWARSGFFQMVGVTVVNLTLLLAAVQWSRREGGAWRAVRLLSALLTAESLLLLLSAAWRMTLYVDVYGLSFKRCMTYWGMGMMAAFLLAAAWKVRRPDFRFCRVVFPLALAGWLVINCVPVDYLVAKDQVDRYLSGESGVLDAEYLLYDLSYDTLSQLERLDGDMVCTAYGDWDAIGTARLSILLEQRRQEARTDCADWRTWSLSAWLASRGGA